MPARALRMLIWDEARVMIESMGGEKMKWVSKVTPSMRGPLSRGSRGEIFNMTGIIIL